MPDNFASITYDAKPVLDLLGDLSHRMTDLTVPMTAIGEYLLLATDDRFEQEKDPDGVPWKPDSPFTINFKKQNNRILKILQSTGRLRNSIAYVATPSSLTMGTIVPYAPDHQFGINGQAKRTFLGISEGDAVVVQEIIQDFIVLGTTQEPAQ